MSGQVNSLFCQTRRTMYLLTFVVIVIIVFIYEFQWHLQNNCVNIIKAPADLEVLLNQTCGQRSYTKKHDSFQMRQGYVDLRKPWVKFPDILLVVLFNFPNYEAIPYLEVLYRPLFPNIVYCGDTPATKVQEGILKDFSLEFVHFTYLRGHRRGTVNYECVIKAMQMNYNVTGYLTIADDILIDIRTIHGLDRERLWIPVNPELKGWSDMKLMKLCTNTCSTEGFWSGLYRYQAGTLRALEAIHNGKQTSFKNCSEILQKKSGGKHRIYMTNADFYYIPKKFAHDVIVLFDVFVKAEVYLEIAVPTVLRCLAPADCITNLPMYWEDLFYHSNGIPGDYKKYVIIHKAKWTPLRCGHKYVVSDFCDIAIPMVHGLIPTITSP